ncbi:hypothetical protein CRE_03910 [Caenorhabditis remanei]|uniref:FERM domain-containing protein n=1 Tax=Caenorhabditis remanei TaxID=31234 RepID=E3LXS8_CAERE|nr:hypothetical protein CRE_03910 [Caenorhabditis remanei]
MGVLSLTVSCSEKGIKKTMQFDPSTLIYDAIKLIREKFGMTDVNAAEYGLIRIDENPAKSFWMDNGRSFEYYMVRNKDEIDYKKKIRYLKVRMLDGAVKTISVDESQQVSQLMLTVCDKIGISNYEEYSLVRDDLLRQQGSIANGSGGSAWNLKDKDNRSKSSDRGGGVYGTMRRKDEAKMEELRKKLHTDEELPWLDHQKTLREQAISEEETLVLRRKYFFSDSNVDSRDPVQLNLLYVQCRDGILRGLHPVEKETALELAALQSHIQYGDFPHDKPKFHLDGRDVLPKEYAKNKDNEKKVVAMYKELSGTSELDAKSKYVHLCRGLKTYGVTFFVVKEKLPGKNKLVPRLLGVNKESVMRVDEKTKEILKEWPLEQVRRWVPSAKTFSLDFGDYQDGYYSVQTTDGEKIAQLIQGYVDIILKKKRTQDHQGIEGDEGSTMLEDMVAPAKATLVAHGQIGNGQHAQDGLVAVRGVLRTPQGGQGYGINGAQYGAVSGEITSQELARAQRLRYQDMYQHPQRALIGTIEATIRAVDEAEVELEAEPQIDIPRFNDDFSQNRWMEEQKAVNKENVNERLAAMGAATAQVVQWTAVEEYDDRVGSAIATIGSNLPDVSRNVRDLGAFMETEERGDLVQATRLLCGAFGDFLTAVNPEQNERRNKVFTAAGRVGEFSQQVINKMDPPSDTQRQYDDYLVQRAKNVATSTAQLVLCAKTISADCEEPHVQERVIQSATKCAFATSQLVACARVVAPTIDNNACQQQLTTAATEVSQSVNNLLHDAEHAVYQQSSLTDIHEAARQVTSALDSLLEHAKCSPKTMTTRREEEEMYNEVLRRTNRMVVHQGPPEDLTREARKVVRHSQLLTEQFQHEAHQRPEHRDRLLDAAAKVAHATSEMILATEQAESQPRHVETEYALRTAAENLGKVTNETTKEQQEQHIMQRLEQAAKQTAYDATQTISASNSTKDVIENRVYSENLVYESTRTAGHLPGLITSIRESQNAQNPSDKFRAQSRLIRDSHNVLETSVRLFESARTAVPMISDTHLASSLDQSANRLGTSLAELRIAVNDAQQLNFSQQLLHSEELIKELDEQLVRTQRMAMAKQLPPIQNATSFSSSSKLMATTTNVGSGVAQLITAATTSNDDRYIGTSAVELAQGLREFADAITEIVTVRTDIHLEKLFVSARSVVHDSGRVFDRVRERCPPTQLTEAAMDVSVNLRQVIACLPDTKHIEEAIRDIQTASTSANIRAIEVRQAANKFIEATSHLVLSIGSPENKEAINVFVRAYSDLHGSVIAQLSRQANINVKTAIVDLLEEAQRGSIGVLETLRQTGNPSDHTLSQQFTSNARELATTVNKLVELSETEGDSRWQMECDAALRRIQAVRHVTQHADVPLSDNGYFASLQSVSDGSRRLGEAMTGMARHAKANDTEGFCTSVRNSADALCSLAESASHSAYLVGISHPASSPGRSALIDASEVARSVESISSSCQRVESRSISRQDLMEDITSITRHSSHLAQLCRLSSEKTQNPNVKKHLVTSAMSIAHKTSSLVGSYKEMDRAPDAVDRCASSASELRQAAQQLLHFAGKPDFAAVQGTISNEGHSAQHPILQASREMLDSSAQMIHTAKSWASAPQDEATWQRMAVNSKEVSDSIMKLVSAIHEAAPGQMELEAAIERLSVLSGQVEKSAMDAYASGNVQQHGANAERQLLQQVQHIASQLEEKVDDLHSAAVEHGERLPKVVQLHRQMVEDLAEAACCAAGMTVDSNQQTELFDKCKTVVEAELAMMVASRESGGNPNAVHAHANVQEAAGNLKHAIGDMRQTIAKVSSEQGAVQGMVDTISSSIANTDLAMSSQHGSSFAEAQTRMTACLEDIRRTAIKVPTLNTQDLGAASLNLSEKYRLVAADVRQAAAMLPDADIGQRLKLAVQKLGTSCIETVKVAGKKRAHPEDERIQRELTGQAENVVERVEQVLAALHAASRGTQACINAANTVSGIIGDLDTTIMFATSGSLNSSDDRKFPAHKDAIVKTAKALVEDTKALVAGAASNQEQLAVAAQNAVRTIVNLSDAVKTGAVSLSSENSETQVLVIHAVRDVAAALTSLIQATKNASGLSLQHPAMGHLKEAAKVMVGNVARLLKTVATVEEKNQQGTRAVEAAVEAIGFEMRQFEHDLNEGVAAPTEARVEHLQQTADHVSEITKRVMAGADGHAPQTEEEIIGVANLSRSAVRSLLAVVRTISNDADNVQQRYAVLDSGRDVANNVKSLLVSLHTQMTRNPGQEESRRLLYEASRGVSNALNNLVGLCTEMSGLPHGHMEMDSAAAQAENELLGAASSIEAASLKLAELRPRQTVQENTHEIVEAEFDENILTSAKGIISAVHILVRAATSAQRELAMQGRTESRPSGSGTYQWSEGLTSASRVVVASVHKLCDAANTLMKGQTTEERLISAAKQVSSSTAQLLVACNVKADPDSQANRRLQAAGQAVRNAAERLVQSAQQVIARDDRNIAISDRLVSGIAQVMDAQEEVLRKERELGEARHKLAHLNKARYERDGEGSPEA